MTAPLGPDSLERLVRELCGLPAEMPWVEFKRSNGDPDTIGDLVSALSNAAALAGKETAWVVWGVEDATHAILGTTFVPGRAKRGNQDLESWLVQVMQPRLHIRFHAGEVDGQPVVALEIPAARDRPTAVNGRELVRVGSTNRTLRDNPEIERDLWRCFERTPFELQAALADQPAAEVLRLLDAVACFRLLNQALPSDRAEVMGALERERFVCRNDRGHWNVTNLGAVLFAVDMAAFPTVARKPLRIVVNRGRGRTEPERERMGRAGYAVDFAPAMEFLGAVLPRNEVIGSALRAEVPMYPDVALREIVANALIHQDFGVTGAGPMVEVFSDRVEVTNPGTTLGDIDRLLDQAPRSRNEALAAFMRRIGLCEERGSGVDRVVELTELYQLPPPRWEAVERSVRAILFAHREFREMDRAERVHACYLHACLQRVMGGQPMSNPTVRKRFGIEEKNSATASRIIKDALDEGRIKPYDPNQGKRNARYLPHWA